MNITDAISRAALGGPLRLTVFPVSDGYQANMSVDGKSWRVEMAPDPVTAMNKVLGLAPGAAGPMLPSAGAFD